MSSFIQANIDYVLFAHSVALLFLALLFLSRSDTAFRWHWLGLFFVAQAAGQWIDILAFCGFSWAVSPTVQVALLLASWLCLAELARTSIHSLGDRKMGWWIHVLLLAAPIALGRVFPSLTPVADVNLTLALPCGFWAAAVFFKSGRRHPFRQARRLIQQAAVCVFTYAVTLMLSTPIKAGKVEALLNRQSPSTLTELGCIAGFVISVAILWLLLQYAIKHADRNNLAAETSHLRQGRIWIVLSVAAVALGWVAAELTGSGEDAKMRRIVLERAELVAAAIPTDKILQLSWSSEDLGNPAYASLRRLTAALVKTNKDLRFALLMGYRDKKAYFLVDSEAADSKDYSPPGQFYDDAARDYLDAVEQRVPCVLGPVNDHWGSWITALVPLDMKLAKAGHVFFELDIAVTDWQTRLFRARLPILMITLLIVALLVGVWLAQRKTSEHAAMMTSLERRSRAIVEGSPNCVQMFDHEGLCLLINENGLSAFGRERAEIIGRPFYSVWPIESRATINEAIQSTLQGHLNQFEIDYVKPDGRRYNWRVSLSPLKDAAGKVVGLVSIGVDITDRKTAEFALMKAKETAEAATRAKSDFLAVMSHEIRTPLSGVIGMLGLLQKQSLPPKQRRYAEIARESAESLLEILNAVLDTAKIESGKMQLEAIPFKPRLELARATEIMRSRADAKELNLLCEVDDSVPDVIIGDPLRLRQVVTNLVSNAIKFTQQGSVTVHLQGEIVGDYFVHLRLDVTDTGVGIEEKALERIFNKFEQEDSSTTRQFGGTGLGLSIVRSIADIMGGDVSVTSRVGEGSTFTFSALLALSSIDEYRATQGSVAAAGSSVNSATLRILCAEDNPTNRLVLQHVLQHMGHEGDFAENGREALEKLRVKKYDVVLMDSRMPEMDGFQATLQIRSPGSGVLDPFIQVIALTANSSAAYRDQCLQAGMNDYLEKPIREETLCVALEKVIAYQRQRGIELLRADDGSVTDVKEAAGRVHGDVPKGLSVEELLAMAGEDVSTPAAAGGALGLPHEAVQTIIRQFLKEAPTRIREMHDAMARNDGPVLARAAHSLKSMSLYVSGEKLSGICAEIEKLADAARINDTLYLVQSAELEFAQVRARLQKELQNQTSGTRA